jgi:hypothetical protein
MNSTGIPYDLSEVDRELIHHLGTHVDSEQEVLDLYQRLSSNDHPYIAFIAGLIGEDETRHHRLFLDWIETIKALAELRDSPDAIPHLDRRPVDLDTVDSVKRLLAFEEEDLVAVKRLRREVHDVRNTTLWGALVDYLIADTKKHIKMLHFLLARIDERHAEAGQ